MAHTNRKSEIHEAAARLFGEKGFAASSVRDIASAVGLGAASLYNHIGSKDELLNSICFRCAEYFLSGMREIDLAEKSPLEKIKDLVRLHIKIALEDSSSATVFNNEWKHLQEPHLSAFLQMRRNYERAFLSIIQEGMKGGLLRSSDPYLMYQHILSSLRWLHQPGVRKMKTDESTITEQIILLSIKGIQA